MAEDRTYNHSHASIWQRIKPTTTHMPRYGRGSNLQPLTCLDMAEDQTYNHSHALPWQRIEPTTTHMQITMGQAIFIAMLFFYVEKELI